MGLGQTNQGMAKTARIGSTCAPRREICVPSTAVVRKKWPCAVL